MGKPNEDDARIDVDRQQDLGYWAERFGVTVEEIREAIKAAGPRVRDVRERLAANRSY